MIPLAILTGMAEPTVAKGPSAMTLIPRVAELRGSWSMIQARMGSRGLGVKSARRRRGLNKGVKIVEVGVHFRPILQT